MEIILKINDGPAASSYKDGDIVRAFSMNEIYYHHAEHKCHVRNFGVTTDGTRMADPLLIKFLEKTRTYKFERVNSNEVLRTNLLTEEQKTLSTNMDADGERIDVYQYVSRRIKNKNHLMFRSNGLEYWYGKTRSDIDVDAIWNDIETHTDFLQSDHIYFPLADIEKRTLLPINCCMHEHTHDYTDLPAHNACLNITCGCVLSECSVDFVSDMNSPIVSIINEGTEEEGIEVLHKRKFQVPYWDLTSILSLDIEDIRNINKEVDLRKPLLSRPAADLFTRDKTTIIFDGE